jgi:hypothetical protein
LKEKEDDLLNKGKTMDNVQKCNIYTTKVVLKNGKNYRIAACVPKEIILKEMTRKIE